MFHYLAPYLVSISESTLFRERATLKNLQNNSYIKLHHYVEDIKGFYPYIDELVTSVFKFKEKYKTEAIRRYKALQPESKMMVSVHIRYTDFVEVSSYFPSYSLQQSYFKRAMSYFHKKYKVRFDNDIMILVLFNTQGKHYFFTHYLIKL